MWWWVLLWAVLLLAAGAFYLLLGLRLWRQTKALLAESAAVTSRLGEITAALGGGAGSAAYDGENPTR